MYREIMAKTRYQEGFCHITAKTTSGGPSQTEGSIQQWSTANKGITVSTGLHAKALTGSADSSALIHKYSSVPISRSTPAEPLVEKTTKTTFHQLLQIVILGKLSLGIANIKM